MSQLFVVPLNEGPQQPIHECHSRHMEGDCHSAEAYSTSLLRASICVHGVVSGDYMLMRNRK